MIKLKFNINQSIKILCLGAHCDDIEIGCGGTLWSVLQEFQDSEIQWIVFSSDYRREEEARVSANIFLEGARSKRIEVERFRNGFFPYIGGEIKDYFEGIKKAFSPDLIFTHFKNDLHQDHRIVSELTWNTFRNNLILEYEIPKYDGDSGHPNFFVPLEYSVCETKVDSILKSYTSQSEKHWMTRDLLLGVMRIRGMECVSPTKYAEAFHVRKIVLKS